MRKRCFFVTACAALACVAYAVQTKTWVEDDYWDFDKGHISKLSLRSDGRLSLGPQFNEIYDSSTPYLWAVAQDSKGNLYTGGGGPGGPGARLYVIPPKGKGKILASLDDLEIHAIAVDSKDQIYVGTSPGGKIYKVSQNGKSQVFYAPKVSYIWAMVFDSKGSLFVATGDKGEVHKVSPDGKGSVFFKTGETHARSLAIDSNDNLIVGTDPGGLILRVSGAGAGFVLYQAAKREITAVAVNRDNTVYAAGVGNRQASVGSPGALSVSMPMPVNPLQTSPSPSSVPGSSRVGTTTPPPASSSGSAGVAGGSEVYRLDREGFPRKVWENSQDIVYSLAFDSVGRPLIGTGNKGLVYRLDADNLYTLLLDTPPTQITGLFTGREGTIFAVTGNVGKIYQIGPGLEKEGSIESDIFDSGVFSYWGRAIWRGESRHGKVALATRSGNLDRAQSNWSPWDAVNPATGRGPSGTPPARFLQWKATLTSSGDGQSPELTAVEIAYQAKNVRPVVDQVEITPGNYRFPPQSVSVTPSQNLTLQPLGRRPSASPSPASADSGATASSMQYAKGFIGARWAASDENGDSLMYRVEIRGVGESGWNLLKEKVREKYLSWDSTAFPDGEYVIRVSASDAPSNPPDQALSADLVSAPFLIDNTPPVITAFSASRTGTQIKVGWHAADERSVIDKAEYSLDGGDWVMAQPVTRLSDSLDLDYNLSLKEVSPGEHTVAVRVTDDYDNQAVAKTLVK